MVAPVVPCPYQGVAARYQGLQAAAIISIVGHEDGYVASFPSKVPVLRLGISDIHCGRVWSPKEVDTVTAKGLVEATEEDLFEALRFARAYHDKPIVVHCHAGVSRSPAIALAILADRHGRGQEHAAVAQLYGSTDAILPNPGIVALADKVLRRQGALVAALDQRRARDTDSAPFTW